jgi:AraC-like DNA-binding protein
MSQTNNKYGVHIHNAVDSLKEYMDTNPLAHKTVTGLWDEHIGSSRSMIEKAFKDITGYRIKEYLVLQRLEYSKTYLSDGMSIKWIAIKIKYKSQSAYCTAFKRFFNTTPTDWLQNRQ